MLRMLAIFFHLLDPTRDRLFRGLLLVRMFLGLLRGVRQLEIKPRPLPPSFTVLGDKLLVVLQADHARIFELVQDFPLLLFVAVNPNAQ